MLFVADGEALATLGATTGENGTAALGGHTGAEAVGLGALALVRLVGTLHGYNPPAAFLACVRVDDARHAVYARELSDCREYIWAMSTNLRRLTTTHHRRSTPL